MAGETQQNTYFVALIEGRSFLWLLKWRPASGEQFEVNQEVVGAPIRPGNQDDLLRVLP